MRQLSFDAGTSRLTLQSRSGSNSLRPQQRTEYLTYNYGIGRSTVQTVHQKHKEDKRDEILYAVLMRGGTKVLTEASKQTELFITHNAAYQADDLDASMTLIADETSNSANKVALMKAQQSKPKLYVGDVIVQTNPIGIPDSEETLALAEESHSKILSKHKDNMMLEKEKQVDTTPIN
ncbi:hypothetical protein Tco_1155135 [Tanacetum coccineum]